MCDWHIEIEGNSTIMGGCQVWLAHCGVYMPIYEFECSSCGHRYDQLQKLSDADPTICPACHAAQLHRRVSAPFFRLAGSGWYETDFKKEGEKKHHLADGGKAPAPAAEAAGAGTSTSSTASTPAPAAAPGKAVASGAAP
jgi:putative FmdB family regulatory protein